MVCFINEVYSSLFILSGTYEAVCVPCPEACCGIRFADKEWVDVEEHVLGHDGIGQWSKVVRTFVAKVNESS